MFTTHDFLGMGSENTTQEKMVMTGGWFMASFYPQKSGFMMFSGKLT